MPSTKVVSIAGIGDVCFSKRRSSKTIKIRISGPEVRVTLPTWVPFVTAISYVNKRSEWIARHKQKSTTIKDGQRFGKQIKLAIKRTDSLRYSSKIDGILLKVSVPITEQLDSASTQQKLENYISKALLTEAERLLIPRVRTLAEQTKLNVNRIEVRKLRSRWGSCTNQNNLTFNLYLIQLPWHIIDYVIYHELAHTKHLNHSPEFWQLVERFTPSYKEERSALRQFSPHIIPQS